VRVAAEHRVGTLEVGDAAVVVVAAAPHRDAAFEACRYVIDELKRRVPIWKREHYADGTAGWVDPTTPEGVSF
jgi:molybdopterin synthase catalytic subunit